MSLPRIAEVLVNCVPANCMPSPESPARRMVADSSSSVRTGRWLGGLASVVTLIGKSFLARSCGLFVCSKNEELQIENCKLKIANGVAASTRRIRDHHGGEAFSQ